MGMDVYGRKPKNETGEYFRANVWSWKPIHYLCFVATQKYEDTTGYDDLIPFKTLQGMQFNQGDGLRSERKCEFLSQFFQGVVDCFFDPSVIPHEHKVSDDLSIGVNKDGEFYMDVGRYIDTEGKILSEEEGKDPNTEKQSPYTVTKEHLQEFSEFLKNCGGFRVW